jgi:hypothetical protein
MKERINLATGNNSMNPEDETRHEEEVSQQTLAGRNPTSQLRTESIGETADDMGGEMKRGLQYYISS